MKNNLERKNFDAKTKASTGAKFMFSGLLCGNKSIYELIQTNNNKNTDFKGIFSKNEYVPKMHGLRDCIKDTNYNQIKEINDDVINKAKENKVKIDIFCILSAVLGVISVVSGFGVGMYVIPNILAMIFAFLGLKNVEKNQTKGKKYRL